MGNRLLFPASSSTYKAEDIVGLFWVPEEIGDAEAALSVEEVKAYYVQDHSQKSRIKWIPCQYLPASNNLGEKHLILYFHGNSCDMGDMSEEMSIIHENTGRHVVQFEFPGYGICQDGQLTPSPPTIDLWGRAVANFLIACKVSASQIIPMGRSIGTGPAARLARYLCDHYGSVGALVLHSPYLSIHAIVTDYAFRPGTFLIPNYWDTTEELKVIARKDVPLLIIHGMADEVIGVRHGKELLDTYQVDASRKRGVFPTNSEHNFYFVMDDIVYPLRQFIAETSRAGIEGIKDIVPEWARKIPDVSSESQEQSAICLGVEARRDDRPINPDAHNSNDVSSILARLLFCGCAFPRPPTPDGHSR